MIAADVVQTPNDGQQLEPMPDKMAGLPQDLGRVGAVLTDNGCFSEDNVNACAAAGIKPVVATGREAYLPGSTSVLPRRQRRRATPCRLR